MIGVPLVTAETVATLAARLGGEADADVRTTLVARIVAPADAALASDLVLVVSRRVLDRARTVPGVLLTTPELAAALPDGRRWIHAHALWALTRLGLGRESDAELREHPAAAISPRARLGAGTRVGPNVVILAGAELGSDCVVEPGAVIYGNTRIGERVVIGANAVIGRPGFGWTTSPAGDLARVPQLGGVEIEDDVEIGPLVTVDAGTLGPTRIRSGAKLDAHVHVGHNAEIGAGSLVAAQAGFAGSVRVGERVLVGGQAGFADHVSIGDGARIAAKSGVIGDIRAGSVVAGFPAVPRVQWLRAMARLLMRARR